MIFLLNEKNSAVCECTDHVDSVGYGDCQAEFKGSFGCYAKQPDSSCTDLIESEGGPFSAAEACQIRGNLDINLNISDICIFDIIAFSLKRFFYSFYV